MKDTLVSIFFAAAASVFETMLDTSALKGTPQHIQAVPNAEDTLHILIEFTGAVGGHVVYAFPTGMTLQMVSALSGMQVETVDDFVTSALGEIGNIISGSAVSRLGAEGHSCDILPPLIFMEKESVRLPDGELLLLPVSTDFGQMTLQVLLHKQ